MERIVAVRTLIFDRCCQQLRRSQRVPRYPGDAGYGGSASMAKRGGQWIEKGIAKIFPNRCVHQSKTGNHPDEQCRGNQNRYTGSEKFKCKEKFALVMKIKAGTINRRRFTFRLLISSAGVFSAGILLESCGRGKTEENVISDMQASTDPCSDLAEVSENDLELRKKFAYVKESPIADNQCNNC